LLLAHAQQEVSSMGTLVQDLRYAVRMLLGRPGFAAVAILTLSIGTGASATIASWIESVLLRPLPGVQDQDQLVALVNTTRSGEFCATSYPDYLDFRDQVQGLSGLIASEMLPLTLDVDGQAQRVWGQIVSGNTFDVLGVRALAGRTFTAKDENGPDSAPFVVLGERFWKRALGADPAVLGRPLKLNGHPYTVLGIVPEQFHGTMASLAMDLWVPLVMQDQLLQDDRFHGRGNQWLELLGRLQPGVSLEQAGASAAAVASALQQAYPGVRPSQQSAVVLPLWKAPFGAQEIFLPVLSVLTGVVALLLLIVCANVASLLVARATDRHREIAVRLSLGASRIRLLRQLLTEGVLLSLLGGLGGILMASWSSGLLVLFIPPNRYPVLLDSGLDSRVLLLCFGLSVLTGVLFGLAPALQATRPDLYAALKDEATGLAGSSRRKGRLRNSLVAAQVALALVLLVSAGLFVRSLDNARAVDPGFNPKGVLLASLDLAPAGYDEPHGVQFCKTLLERLEAVPGVRSATLARELMLGFTGGAAGKVDIEGYVPQPGEDVNVAFNSVGPGYFRTMQMPLVAGRELTARDGVQDPGAAVINETMARRYWPGQDPLGKRLRMQGKELTVVGVVRNAKYRKLDEAPMPFLFLPLFEFYLSNPVLHVRAEGDPEQVLAAVRQAVQALDANVPLFEVRSFNAQMQIASFLQRMAATLLGLFGLVALGLSALGLYGVMAYAVGQRTREIGLRMALGARAADILRLVVGQGARLTAAGMALGLAGALAVTPLVRSQLLGVSPTDPATFAAITLGLGAVAMLASYLPARRAVHVDPMTALRHE
jgi:putative ABC transport system permease protein